MQRLANGTQVSALPTIPAAVGTPGYATNGNPAGGQEASIFDAHAFNAIQEELISFILAAGLTPSRTNLSQLLLAAQSMFGATLTATESGGFKHASGFHMQWGRVVSSGLPNTGVVFPAAFANQARSVIITEQNASGWGAPPEPTVYGANSIDRFGFQAYAVRILQSGGAQYQAGLGFNWLAVGS